MFILRLIILCALLAYPSTPMARAREVLPQDALIRLFSYAQRESKIYLDDHLVQFDAAIPDSKNKKDSYLGFYFKKQSKTLFLMDFYYSNIYVGYPFYRYRNGNFDNCQRYYSKNFDTFWKKIRNATPIDHEIYVTHYQHYLEASEPFGLSCAKKPLDPKRLTLEEVEPIFRIFMKEQGLIEQWNYWVGADNPQYHLSYYYFTLTRSPGKNRPRTPIRVIYMNSWTGEIYEDWNGSPCTIWSSPALRAARIALYARKGLTDSDLAPHHAHFRTITDPRSANCLGDRLDGLTTTAEEFGIISPQKPDTP